MITRNTIVPGAALRDGLNVLGILAVLVTSTSGQDRLKRSEPDRTETTARGPQRLAIGTAENTYRLTPRLYSGGEPRGVETFTALKKLGVRTILSVDGAMPDHETAREMGFRYVHLPIGYDGVPREQAVRMIKAIKSLPGPVYVHCHHGLHRGPAAAAICGLATEGWTKEQAIDWMKQVGTSPSYSGLFDSARKFVPPTAEEMERAGTEFPERAKVPALVEMMVQVDQRWDRMKAIEKAGFKPPPDQPDIDPPHEALQLLEHFRELVRLPEAKERGAEFLATAAAAQASAAALEDALRAFGKEPTTAARKKAEAAFLATGKSCTGCHAQHRDH